MASTEWQIDGTCSLCLEYKYAAASFSIPQNRFTYSICITSAKENIAEFSFFVVLHPLNFVVLISFRVDKTVVLFPKARPAAMKLSSAALLLAFVSSPAAASPVKSRQATNPSFFTITAARSGSAIHQQSVHASNRAFWIGKPTETYCPPQVDAEAACPPGTETVLAFGDTAASLVSSDSFTTSRFPSTCLQSLMSTCEIVYSFAVL